MGCGVFGGGALLTGPAALPQGLGAAAGSCCRPSAFDGSDVTTTRRKCGREAGKDRPEPGGVCRSAGDVTGCLHLCSPPPSQRSVPKMAPKWPQSDLQSVLKVPPDLSPNVPKVSPKMTPRCLQNGSPNVPKCPEVVPIWPQMALKCPKTSQKWSKNGPKWPQNVPQCPQMSQKCPQIPPNGPKMSPDVPQ